MVLASRDSSLKKILDSYDKLGSSFDAFNSQHSKKYSVLTLQKISPLGLKRHEFPVLEILIWSQNKDTGQCNITNKRIGEMLGISESTVKRALSGLKRKLNNQIMFEYYKTASTVTRRQISFNIDLILQHFFTTGQNDPLTQETLLNSTNDISSGVISFRNNIESGDSIHSDQNVGEKKMKLSEIIKYKSLEENNVPNEKKEKKILNVQNEKRKITESKDIINIMNLKVEKERAKNFWADDDEPEMPESPTVIFAKSRFQSSDIPVDIQQWASSQTPNDLNNNKHYKNKQWAMLRLMIDPDKVIAELVSRHKPRITQTDAVARSESDSITSWVKPDCPVTKKQLMNQRIREIPLRYVNYKEVLKKENCIDLKELQFRMMENDKYDPFELDTYGFDHCCHPRYGFMNEEERDNEFMETVDLWFGKPNKWYTHTDRNKKMFRKARIRADVLRVTYYDWIAAQYFHWGCENILYTHLNNRWAEEIYEKWEDKNKPYPMNLGAMKLKSYYVNKKRNKDRGNKLTFRTQKLDDIMEKGKQIVDSIGDSWKY